MILNTRTSQALTQAGIPRSQWASIDRTGDQFFERMLDGQLSRNKLTSEEISTVRPSGDQSIMFCIWMDLECINLLRNHSRWRKMINYTELSKEISYALRHAPWEYELEMDEEGWVPVEQLLDALHKEEKWRNVSENDLVIMIQKSEKKRHEIYNGKIKAYYGHSIPMKIVKEEKVPPEVLYHGTARRFLNSIREKGLLPKGRQYVHLSQDIETARSVGMRHDMKPCILKIDAKQAWKDGITFYYGNEKVWLADEIPSKYIMEM